MVNYIDGSAFVNCSGLTKITSLIPAENLFELDSAAFRNVDKSVCTLYVPIGAKAKYASTGGWNEFTNIVELNPNYEYDTLIPDIYIYQNLDDYMNGVDTVLETVWNLPA